MNEWLQMSMPWWHFVVRGAIAYVGLLVLLRLSGKRSFGEMSPFDIVVLILVGGALRSAIMGDDKSVLAPFIAVSTMLVLERSITYMATLSARFNRAIEGSPVVIARNGKLIPDALRRNAVPEEDFCRELRIHGIADVAKVREARLEPNGKISVLT